MLWVHLSDRAMNIVINYIALVLTILNVFVGLNIRYSNTLGSGASVSSSDPSASIGALPHHVCVDGFFLLLKGDVSQYTQKNIKPHSICKNPNTLWAILSSFFFLPILFS